MVFDKNDVSWQVQRDPPIHTVLQYYHTVPSTIVWSTYQLKAFHPCFWWRLCYSHIKSFFCRFEQNWAQLKLSFFRETQPEIPKNSVFKFFSSEWLIWPCKKCIYICECRELFGTRQVRSGVNFQNSAWSHGNSAWSRGNWALKTKNSALKVTKLSFSESR